MKHATTRLVFSYWDALRGERAAPERGEVDPGEIRHALADTFILELACDRTAEIRLAGTRLCALFGRELKGKHFASLWRASLVADLDHYLGIVVEDTTGLVIGLVGTTDEGSTIDLEMILLPLRHRGKTHARILGALSPAFVPPWIGFYPLTSLQTKSLRVLSTAGRVSEVEISRADASPGERRSRFVVHAGGRGGAAS
jgi:hypothetical protein